MREAIEDGDTDRAVHANAAFHQTLVEVSGSRLLASLIAPVASRMRWLLTQHDDPAALHAEHAAIFAVLLDRDADRAATLCADHLRTSRAALDESRHCGTH